MVTPQLRHPRREKKRDLDDVCSINFVKTHLSLTWGVTLMLS